VLNYGSHRSHTCPWADTYDWGPGIVRKGDKSFRDRNQNSITLQGDQWVRDTTKKNTGKTETYQGPALTGKTCIFLSVGLSGESCSLPSQRKGVFPSGNSSVFLSSWIDPNRLDPYLYRTRNRELSRSQWGKNIKNIVEGYPHGTKFLQDFFDCPTHHLRVLVEIILR